MGQQRRRPAKVVQQDPGERCSICLPASMHGEMELLADQLDTSVSWVIQQAWRKSRRDLLALGQRMQDVIRRDDEEEANEDGDEEDTARGMMDPG